MTQTLVSNVNTRSLIVSLGQALFYAIVALFAWRIAGTLADRALDEAGVSL